MITALRALLRRRTAGPVLGAAAAAVPPPVADLAANGTQFCAGSASRWALAAQRCWACAGGGCLPQTNEDPGGCRQHGQARPPGHDFFG